MKVEILRENEREVTAIVDGELRTRPQSYCCLACGSEMTYDEALDHPCGGDVTHWEKWFAK